MILLAMLILIMLIGQAMSTDPLEVRSKSIQFNYEESINGHGNFASYNKVYAEGPHSDARVQKRLANVSLQKMDRGSGSIEREAIIVSNKLIKTQVDPDLIYAYALIAALEDSSMVYEPQTIFIGNGYYAKHPLNFNSLLGDETQIKNYASETSMVQETKYAKAINKDLVVSVEDDYSGWEPAKSVTRTLMKLNDSVNSGTAHIGMLQGFVGSRDFGKSALHKPNIYVDEDYRGTFNFGIKMNLTLPVYKSSSDDSWLPCCSGGWEDMMYSDKKSFGTDAKGIFDCTCPKVLSKD